MDKLITKLFVFSHNFLILKIDLDITVFEL